MLRLLASEPAIRIHRTPRQGDYTWVHPEANVKSITQALHGLFCCGLAEIANDNQDMAVITERGLQVLRLVN
jgi:hypothetical protein